MPFTKGVLNDTQKGVVISKIEVLGIKKELQKILGDNDIWYVGELMQYGESDLLCIHNFEVAMLGEVKRALHKHGLDLLTPLPGWVRPEETITHAQS